MTIENLDNLMAKLNTLSTENADKAAYLIAMQGGAMVKSAAQDLAPRGLEGGGGDLIRSIRPKMDNTPKGYQASVYTINEHALYVEVGTGPNGEADHANISPEINPKYSKTGWVMPGDVMKEQTAIDYGLGVYKKDGEVKGYYTRGQRAQPFMYPALKNSEKAIKKDAIDIINKKIKEVSKK